LVRNHIMWKKYFVSLGILSIAFISLLPTRGLAQGIDEMAVIDSANLFQNRIDEVEASVDKLVALGAEVRVRTILTYGNAGSLDQYEAQLEKESPSWNDQNGSIKYDLVVLIISLQERETGIYYGNAWDNILGNRWEAIINNNMNPDFRNGNYASGTIKGLDQIGRLIKEAGQTPTGNQSFGKTQWWIVPIVVLAVIGLIIGLILFFYLRSTRAKISAARQKALLAKQGAAASINEQIEAIKMLEIKVNVTADRITPEEASPLHEGFEKAKNIVDRSSESYSNLAHSAGDPENPRLGEAELGVIEAEYKKILGDLSQSTETVKKVEAEVAAVQRAVDSFGDETAKINAEIEKLLSIQSDLNKAGYRTNFLTASITSIRNTLEQANNLVAGKRVLEGMEKISLARDEVTTTIQAVEDLPKKKLDAEKSIELLTSRIEQVKQTVDSGRDNFESIATNYAGTTWAPIQGNGTEAENRVNWAIEALEDAKEVVRSEQQEWTKAIDLVATGNKWLTEAESLISSISILESNLTKARQDSPAEISAAEIDIKKAWDYINQYDEDIRESLEDELRAAENKNNMAKEELDKAKPDYFSICKLAREANESADRILVQARNEHEATERLRSKAASTRRDASARVSITRKYVEDHYQVVKTEARNYLSAAEEALRQADVAADIEAQLALTSKAETAANNAYSLAQQDVNNSWQRPVSYPETPVQNTPPIIFPGIPSAPAERPPSGGGGNTSWGSPRGPGPNTSGTIRHGGGSSSWGSRGGSGQTGGGSRGW
jgi:uncharacterized membrane protein YgcG